MIAVAGILVFVAIVLILMYVDHRRETKAKHAQ